MAVALANGAQRLAESEANRKMYTKMGWGMEVETCDVRLYWNGISMPHGPFGHPTNYFVMQTGRKFPCEFRQKKKKKNINKTSSPKWNFNYAGAIGTNATYVGMRMPAARCGAPENTFHLTRVARVCVSLSPFRVRQFKWYANGSRESERRKDLAKQTKHAKMLFPFRQFIFNSIFCVCLFWIWFVDVFNVERSANTRRPEPCAVDSGPIACVDWRLSTDRKHVFNVSINLRGD